MKRPQKNTHKEGPVLMAGWVFADLLLGLAVIFLASVSFQNGKVDSTAPDQALKAAANKAATNSSVFRSNEDGFSFLYQTFSKRLVIRDIENHLRQKGLTNESRVIYLQAIGGYDQKSEYSDSGAMRATKYIIELKKAKIPYFESSGIEISTSSEIPSGQILLRLAFVPN